MHGRGRWRAGAVLVPAALLLGVACHGERRAGPRVPTDTAAAIPLPGSAAADSLAASVPATAGSTSVAPAPAVPVILHRADSVAGDAIYHGRGRCFTCHGGLGRGTTRLGPDLADSIWLNGDSSFAAIRAVIASGVATPRQFSVAMPAYAGMLDDSALTRVAAYVYALSHPGALLSDSAAADTVHRPDSIATPAGPRSSDSASPTSNP